MQIDILKATDQEFDNLVNYLLAQLSDIKSARLNNENTDGIKNQFRGVIEDIEFTVDETETKAKLDRIAELKEIEESNKQTYETKLAEIYAPMIKLNENEQLEMDAVIPDNIRIELDNLREVFSRKRESLKAECEENRKVFDIQFVKDTDGANKEYATLEAGVRADVLSAGHSIKGTKYTMQYVKGSIDLDEKTIKTILAAHPEYKELADVTEPSTRLAKNR
jgi:hypothetical protein